MPDFIEPSPENIESMLQIYWSLNGAITERLTLAISLELMTCGYSDASREMIDCWATALLDRLVEEGSSA